MGRAGGAYGSHIWSLHGPYACSSGQRTCSGSAFRSLGHFVCAPGCSCVSLYGCSTSGYLHWCVASYPLVEKSSEHCNSPLQDNLVGSSRKPSVSSLSSSSASSSAHTYRTYVPPNLSSVSSRARRATADHPWNIVPGHGSYWQHHSLCSFDHRTPHLAICQMACSIFDLVGLGLAPYGAILFCQQHCFVHLQATETRPGAVHKVAAQKPHASCE